MRRILSIDGGGIKGVIPAAFLATIEEATDKRIVDHFDLIAGTSTGGIIALGLGLGLSAQDILGFYVNEGPAIFEQEVSATNTGRFVAALRRYRQRARRLIKPKYGADHLKVALRRALGDARVGDSSTRLVVPAFDAHRREIHVFKTSHHERFTMDWKVPAVDVALATAAAPTYFPTHVTENGIGLLDGGLWANNPVGLATVEAVGVLDWPRDQLYVLSIGCSEEALRIPVTGGIGAFGRCAIEVMMLGQSRAAIGTAKLLTQHSDERKHLYRYNTVVPAGTFAIDSVDQISVLKGVGVAAAREALPDVGGRSARLPRCDGGQSRQGPNHHDRRIYCRSAAGGNSRRRTPDDRLD